MLRTRLTAVVTGVVLLAGAGGAVALSGLDSHPIGFSGDILEPIVVRPVGMAAQWRACSGILALELCGATGPRR